MCECVRAHSGALADLEPLGCTPKNSVLLLWPARAAEQPERVESEQGESHAQGESAKALVLAIDGDSMGDRAHTDREATITEMYAQPCES